MFGAVLICAVLSWSDGDSGRCDGLRFRLHGIDASEGPPLTRCRAQPTIWACRPENRRHAAPAEARARQLTRYGPSPVQDAAHLSEGPADTPGRWVLRQDLPHGTDLSLHSQAQLNAVARQLNERTRTTWPYRTPAKTFAACVSAIS